MSNRARNILLGSAALVAAVGVLAFVLGGLRTSVQCHGIRLAAVLFFCGMLAGSGARRPRIARGAADFGLLLLAAAAVNYVRLGLKWHALGAGEISRWWHAAVMAMVCLVAVILLARARSWPSWRPLPPLRRGLAFASGTVLVTGGFVVGIGSRGPGPAVAQALGPLPLTSGDAGPPPSAILVDALSSSPDAGEVDDATLDATGAPPADVAAAPEGDVPVQVIREGVARSIPSTRTPEFTAPEGVGVSARIDPRINDRVSARRLRAGALHAAAAAQTRQRRRATSAGARTVPIVDRDPPASVSIALGPEAPPVPDGPVAPEETPVGADVPSPPAEMESAVDDDALVSLLETGGAAATVANPSPESTATRIPRSVSAVLVILGLVLVGAALSRR